MLTCQTSDRSCFPSALFSFVFEANNQRSLILSSELVLEASCFLSIFSSAAAGSCSLCFRLALYFEDRWTSRRLYSRNRCFSLASRCGLRLVASLKLEKEQIDWAVYGCQSSYFKVSISALFNTGHLRPVHFLYKFRIFFSFRSIPHFLLNLRIILDRRIYEQLEVPF